MGSKKFKTINGWTKAQMIATVQSRMLDHLAVAPVNDGDKLEVGQSIACKYRTGDGNRCGVGVFIPDENYLPEMEGNGAIALLTGVRPELMNFMPLEADGMASIQQVHDGDYKYRVVDPRPRIIDWINRYVEDEQSA